MLENERNSNWFAIESKSFKISMEGEGKKERFFIIEHSRGLSLWIRFGEEGMRKFLTRVEDCCSDFPPVIKSFEWREN